MDVNNVGNTLERNPVVLTPKLKLAVAASVVAVVAPLTALPALAASKSSVDNTAVVGNTQGLGLVAHDAPRLNAANTGTLKTGQKVRISCQTTGDSATGPWHNKSTLWSHVDGVGYVADAWLNTGTDGRIQGVPSCKSKPPKPPKSTTGKGKLVPIRQGQGQAGQWYDCGPASLVMALHAVGKTPEKWNAGKPVNSILAARKAMQEYDGGGTYASQARTGLKHYGISSTSTTNMDDVLAAARKGKVSMVMGSTSELPWPKDVINPNQVILHWVVVAGYDSKSKKYLVLDPASAASSNTVHKLSGNQIKQYNRVAPGQGAVILNS